jgi:FMN phosphatase YigB (HAD superfamily)
MNKNTIIFDLDGTLANIDVRRKLATKPNGKLDWNVFHNPSNIKLDVILKKDMLDKHADIDDVFLVVDDRNKVVDMWRSLGLTVFQVADGDF